MDGSDQIHVGGVGSRRVRVIEQEYVVFIYVTRKPANDHLACLGGIDHVVQEAKTSHQQAAVSAIQPDHKVMTLVRDRRSGNMLERDHRFVRDRGTVGGELSNM